MKKTNILETGTTRAEFLRLTAKLAGAGIAGSLFTPASLALAADVSSQPVLRRPIPSSGEMIPVIGVGTAVAYERIEGDDPKFSVLVDSIRTFLSRGGMVIDT